MKRGIAALLIFVLIVLSGSVSNNLLTQKADRLYVCAANAIDSEDSRTQLQKEWTDERLYFALFTNHEYFESIDTNINLLCSPNSKDRDSLCSQIASEFLLLREKLSFKVENIF